MIYFASDHAGFELKGKLLSFVRALGYDVTDLGAAELDPEDDYPQFITPCAEMVAREADAKGIILGGSGQGEAMAANRIKGVRAAVYYGGKPELVPLARQHNDANVLSIGARFVTEAEATAAVQAFLETPFSAEPRHIRRLAEF